MCTSDRAKNLHTSSKLPYLSFVPWFLKIHAPV